MIIEARNSYYPWHQAFVFPALAASPTPPVMQGVCYLPILGCG